jgi:holo-[acyl-carrier protein] synthase
MMRLFHGIDLVNIGRLQRLMARHAIFLEDVFTEAERADCLARSRPQAHLAGRFAVKEACLKALGHGLSTTGIDRVLSDIEVRLTVSGQPALILHGWAKALGRKKHIIRHTVSISHSAEFAIAMVLLVGKDPRRTPNDEVS